MLVLSRKTDQRIVIVDQITQDEIAAITVVRVGPGPNSVRLGIEAPRRFLILRDELARETPVREMPVRETPVREIPVREIQLVNEVA